MTTTIAFATGDCLVVGCDSLETSIRPALNLDSFVERYFDSDNKLKMNADGTPELSSLSDVVKYTHEIPIKSVPNVTKLYSFAPANCAALFAGAASIGDESVSNLVDRFLSNDEIATYFKEDYNVLGIADRLADFIGEPYQQVYSRNGTVPEMEVIVAGYSHKESKPEIHIIMFTADGQQVIESKNAPGEPVIVFSGQASEIRRIMLGIDLKNTAQFTHYMELYLAAYRIQIKEHLKTNQEIEIELPFHAEFEELPEINTSWASGINSDISNFSEQAAINLVDFLIDVMIKSQEFDSNMATVGGDIHIGLMTKRSGFNWISKENYSHRGHEVPKHTK